MSVIKVGKSPSSWKNISSEKPKKVKIKKGKKKKLSKKERVLKKQQKRQQEKNEQEKKENPFYDVAKIMNKNRK